MIGNKLHTLLNELSTHQQKVLLARCKQSNHKVMQLLHAFLLQKDFSILSLNAFLKAEVERNWPLSNVQEKELKIRRFASLFADEIEAVILETYLEQKKSIRNILLAQALETKGNTQLLNQYYEKGYKHALEDEDDLNQMIGLKGKFRMNYASPNEKDLHKALDANEEFLRVLKFSYDDRLIEYYHNKTNIYLEKNSLIDHEKEQLIREIEGCLEHQQIPLNKASLYFSLAKLHFNSPKLYAFLAEGKKYLEEDGVRLRREKVRSKEYEAFYRKALFLELRLNFFSGKPIHELTALTDRILQENQRFTIMNNNTLFYKILFTILNNEIETAERLLNENHIYFRGQGNVLEDFLRAVLFEKRKEYRKALNLLNELMYTSNYFFAVFARLLFISIQIKRNNYQLIKSIVDSTNRMLVNNPDSPLGQDAHMYTLLQLKNKSAKRKQKTSIKDPHLTVFHTYLLEEV
jgi:hypothetical protein